MGADADIITVSHFVEIFNNIPHAQLFIMPGATHGMPRMEQELFNSIASKFIEHEFLRPTSAPPLASAPPAAR